MIAARLRDLFSAFGTSDDDTRPAHARRDWLLGDPPAYATGAGAVAFVVGDAVAGQWLAWLLATPFVVFGPIVAAAIFGRTRDE